MTSFGIWEREGMSRNVKEERAYSACHELLFVEAAIVFVSLFTPIRYIALPPLVISFCVSVGSVLGNGPPIGVMSVYAGCNIMARVLLAIPLIGTFFTTDCTSYGTHPWEERWSGACNDGQHVLYFVSSWIVVAALVLMNAFQMRKLLRCLK